MSDFIKCLGKIHHHNIILNAFMHVESDIMKESDIMIGYLAGPFSIFTGVKETFQRILKKKGMASWMGVRLVCGQSRVRSSRPATFFCGERGFDPHVRQHSFAENGHEIISVDILSLPLIQEGQLSVTGENLCTIKVLVNRFGGLPRNSSGEVN